MAHRLAARTGSPILSADSMLVYRGMDIGTAKPTPAERACVRYAGLDWVNPDEPFSVGDYRRKALIALETWQSGGAGPVDWQAEGPGERVPMVVGGTGLYIKSLTAGLARTAPVSSDSRTRWTRLLDEGGSPALREALRQRAPALLEALSDPDNPRRLIRALERVDQGDAQMPSSWVSALPARPLVGLAMDPARLALRIESRVRCMYGEGFVEEVDDLRRRWGTFSATAGQAIGYAEVMAMLEGRCTRDEAMARTMVRTRQLAKRQRTWFRHQADVRWVEVQDGDTPDELAEKVWGIWREYGPTGIAE